MVRIPAVIEISRDTLEGLLAEFGDRPQGDGGSIRLPPGASVTPLDEIELPPRWQLISEEHGVTYSWPRGSDIYEPFRTYEGTSSSGTFRIAIGECERSNVRGKDRKYLITHHIGSGGGKRPVSEFLEVDDYEETGDLIAVIKGKGGGAKLYDPGDELPAVYARYRTETYRNRIDYPRSYEKFGILAREDDHETMLNHSLIQILSRGLDVG